MSETIFDLRVLIFSTNPLARVGLVSILADFPACEIVGEASSDEELLDLLERTAPDVLLWDVGWDAELAAEGFADWQDRLPPVVALLPNEDDAELLMGVAGLLLQHTAPEPLVAALVAAAQGLTVLDPVFYQPAPEPESESPSATLTPREHEVLLLLARGLPNKTIAAQLGVSMHTIKFHINAIFNKLGVQSRTEAVVRATQLGMIAL